MTHMDEHPEPEHFELSGGALCLDFANTWGNHADEGSDGLRSYEQLVAFARQTGMLEASAAEAFLRSGAGKPKAAAAALALARELRQSVYRLFSARADCRDLPLADVDRINSVLGQALSHRRLERRVGGFDWSWSDFDETDLRTPVWPLIESAAALLTSDDLGRVRECDAEDCNWLFLDRSRSGSRRWCSMKSCGNRAKARRHYRRRRES